MESSALQAQGGPRRPVRILHDAVAGRARLHVPSLLTNARFERRLGDELTGRPGIRRAVPSRWTGNVLVLFDPELELAAVVAVVAAVVETGPADDLEPPRLLPPCRNGSGRSETGGASWLDGALEAMKGRWGERQAADAEEGSEPPPAPTGGAWHAADPDQVLALLETRAGGLSAGEVEARLARFGPNRLPRTRLRPPWRLFLGQVATLPVALLLGSAVLSVATGGVTDAVVILAVVLLNAVIGTVTEGRAEQTIRSLTRLGSPEAVVVRDGVEVRLDAEAIVPGDLLVLRRGSWVPADARLLESRQLSVDESTLTGESLAATKVADTLGRLDVPLADRVNMVYRGTLVTGGSARAVVVAAGRHTEMGRVQSLIAGAEQPETPIQRQLNRMGREMVILATGVSAAIAVIGLLRGHPFLEILKTTVSLAVAAVPEGLPAVATTTLAYGVRTLRRQDVLVRRLEAVEAFGCLEILCLDKTGTITANRMRVVEAFAGGHAFPVNGGRPELADEAARRAAPALSRLLEVAALCSEAEPAPGGEVVGSPTEAALVRAALAGGVDVGALRTRHPRVRIEHRGERRMFMVTEHDVPGGEAGEAEARRRLVAMKGRPDEVLALCSRHLANGEVRELTTEDRRAIEAANEQMAGAALRVLGVAVREAPAGEIADRELTWLGLLGMVDPPREGMRELVERFRRAGVRTVMITGDQSATANAVGRMIGLAPGDDALESLDSVALEALDPELLSALVERVHIFSRVSPAHKLQIVRALQRGGRVVAMTGDGINDGPALKAADIGIAMGGGGAELAREVADVVLPGDRIEMLLSAVGHGRTTHEDIRKSVHFIASTNLSEILVTLVSVAAGLGMPFGPKQLLWINLLTDVFPEIALAVEPPEDGVLDHPPLDPNAPVISGAEYRRIATESGVITAATMAGYAYGRMRHGPGRRADTIAFLSLTGAQLLHTFSSRSEVHSVLDEQRLPENRLVSWAVGSGVAIQVIGTLADALRRLLGTTRIGAADAAVSAGSALASFVFNEGLKLVRRSPTRRGAETVAGQPERSRGGVP